VVAMEEGEVCRMVAIGEGPTAGCEGPPPSPLMSGCGCGCTSFCTSTWVGVKVKVEW